MISGIVGELGKLHSPPLDDLSALVRTRDVAVDLVDEEVAEAIARALETGTTWGSIALTLRGK